MRAKTFVGGIFPHGKKEITADVETIIAEAPPVVLLPLSQHIGAPSKPIVDKGQRVLVGEKIGEAGGFVSAPVHSSVSGVVKGFEEVSGYGRCVVIENDYTDEFFSQVEVPRDPRTLSVEDLRKIVFEAGIVGLGGAAFPSHVKFAPPENKRIDFLILNGSECEPFLTADYRLMLEHPRMVVAGMKYIMKMVGAPAGCIGIEDNKERAIRALSDAAADMENIAVVPLKEKYPQGSEKQIIQVCTGREVPSGGLPMDIGVVVSNIGTAYAVTEAVEKGRPLIERIVTVSGSGICNPGNFKVRIGTLVGELVKQAGGYSGKISKIIIGGPMMGKTVYTDLIPVTKGTSGILAFCSDEVAAEQPKACVRCAKCVNVCPISLEPTTIAKYAEQGKWQDAKDRFVFDCIECGCCTYVCPAGIPLVQHIRNAKNILKEQAAKQQSNSSS